VPTPAWARISYEEFTRRTGMPLLSAVHLPQA
jgi:endonuclease G